MIKFFADENYSRHDDAALIATVFYSRTKRYCGLTCLTRRRLHHIRLGEIAGMAASFIPK